MPRIYTRSGDDGTTGLLLGGRVSKDDPRCEAYGAVDEAVSALGLARALCRDERVRGVIAQVQRELFIVGAELATSPSHYGAYLERFPAIGPEHTSRLERLIDHLEGQVALPSSFILPGGSPGSSALDLARAVLRRAERRVVALHRRGLLPNGEHLRYLNRLADLLFVLARYEDRGLPPEEVRVGQAGP